VSGEGTDEDVKEEEWEDVDVEDGDDAVSDSDEED
jgi:hypothetical protein